ncbi:MAG: hypothetical protein IBJ18_11730 [Phycisphaerales bacterium]|nr:hypothetical protein [Phycisphaerales bacterium]
MRSLLSRRSLKTFVPATASLALLASGGSCFAQHAGDIGLGLVDSRIVTGEITPQGEFAPGTRVFASDFGELLPNFTDEPGFDNLPGTFPFPSSIHFTVNGRIRKWDNGAFSTDPITERIEIGFAEMSPVLTPLVNEPIEGFGLTVSTNGEWHRHLQYTLQEPASDGIYLLELVLTSSVPTILPSRPFWIVFNQNRTELEHDEAIDWVVTNLAGGGTVVVSCNPADIACDNGTPLTLDPQCTNSALGPNEGDYNAFFSAEGFFFQAGVGTGAVGSFCDIAADDGTPLNQNPAAANNGVNEGDYNAFFNSLFIPCV